MNDENEGLPRYRVLVQGLAPGPFLRRYTLECRRTHEILDLVAARLTAERIARWGILAVDETGRVVFANSRFAEMWHIPRELLEGGQDAELLGYVRSQLRDPDRFLAKVRKLHPTFN